MTGGVGLSGSVGSSTFPFGFSILVGGVGFSSEMNSCNYSASSDKKACKIHVFHSKT
ncbi:hypothetical protein [Bacillus cereus]|uniref:hypothetical protein n=1 Tax=Bacillus cereus TaxID=1396 RepID=UPI003D65662E